MRSGLVALGLYVGLMVVTTPAFAQSDGSAVLTDQPPPPPLVDGRIPFDPEAGTPPEPLEPAPLDVSPLSFDLNAVPTTQSLPPPVSRPLQPAAGGRRTLPQSAAALDYEEGQRRRQQAAQERRERRSPNCEQTATGIHCSNVIASSSNGEGPNPAEDTVRRELDRLSNPPPR